MPQPPLEDDEFVYDPVEEDEFEYDPPPSADSLLAGAKDEIAQVQPPKYNDPKPVSHESLIRADEGLWEKLNRGMWQAPGEWGRAADESLNTPTKDSGYWGATGKSLAGYGARILGEGVTQATSPIDLAATIATAGASKYAMPMLRRGAQALSAAPVVHGLGEVAQGNPGGIIEAGLGALGVRGVKGPKDVPVPASKTVNPPAPNIPTQVGEITKYPPLPKTDYSVAATEAARKVLQENGYSAETLGLTNKGIVDMAAELAPAAPPAKPRYKTKINKETGSLEPDLTDPDTKAAFELANAKKVDPNQAADDLKVIKETPESALNEPSKLRQIYDLARGTLSVDLPFITSAGLRQGRRMMLNKEWWNAWAPSVKSYGSEVAAKAHKAELMQNPYFKRAEDTSTGVVKVMPSIADEAGIVLSDIDGKLSAREDQIRSTLAEKIPGFGRAVRASNRSYNAFINDLRVNGFAARMDAATQFYEAAKKSGKGFLGRNLTADQIEELNPNTNAMLREEIADQIMNLTGRGKLETKVLGKTFSAEKHRSLFNDLLFSPGMAAAQMQLLDPRKYLMTSPTVRRQYLRGALAWGVSLQAMNSMAQALGSSIEYDPTSADFLKPRVGENTRLDTAGGTQQYLVALSRLAMGQSKSTQSGQVKDLGVGYKPDTRWDVAERFAANKLHPMMRFGYDLLNADEKNKFPVGDKITQAFVPMIAQDAAELVKEDPRLLALLPGISAGAVGTQVYDKDFRQNLFFGDEPGNEGMLPVPDLELEGAGLGSLFRDKPVSRYQKRGQR